MPKNLLISAKRLLSVYFVAYFINKLRGQVNARLPFDRIERQPNTLKQIIIFEPSKDAEIQIWLHVQDSMLTVIK